MKQFLSDLLRIRRLDDAFWQQSFARLTVTPPTPKKVLITKNDDVITIRESHSVGSWWLSEPHVSYDDLEMAFRVTEAGDWIPLYLKEGSNKPRLAYRIVEESFCPKPIVAKRQLLFAKQWADRFFVKGLLQGIVEIVADRLEGIEDSPELPMEEPINP